MPESVRNNIEARALLDRFQGQPSKPLAIGGDHACGPSGR